MVVINGKRGDIGVIQDETTLTLAETEILEKHHHNFEYWFGLHPSFQEGVDCGSRDSMNPYIMTSGNDDYGDWLCILGSNDTPVIAGKTRYDPHRAIYFDADQKETVHRIQVVAAANTTAADAAAAAGQVCDAITIPATNKSVGLPTPSVCPRPVASTPLWARVWVDSQTAKEYKFFLGIHEYDE